MADAERRYETTDGLTLHTASWKAEGEARRGLLLVHGLGEHAGRWAHVARFFAAHGYEVLAYDHRGHGRSGGARSHVGAFGDFVDDLQGIVESGLLRTDLPWVLYGHSLGGLISATYLAEDRPHPAAAVLSAPALGAVIPRVLRIAAQVLGRIAPRLALANAITGEQLSRDPAVGEAYVADPRVHTKATTRLGLEILRAQARVGDILGRIDTPTLVIHGGEDPLVPPSASAPLAGIPGVDRKLYPGLCHEMHNEPEQRQVLSDVAAWLDGKLA